ncbi:MAG: hypothetical protein ACI9QN_002642 [Arcticibacterium sp.]|jgi:hypothetical protein
MKLKLLATGSLVLLLFALEFSNNLLSNQGTDVSPFFTSTLAQSLEGGGSSLEGGGERTEWFYFDCEYVQGKYCSSVRSDSSCGKSKEKPISAC